MEDHDTKQIRKNPIISLKEIPPLDPSSIPIHSSLKPRRMMEPINVAKQRYEKKSELKLKKVHKVEEDKAMSSFSNIQIDPNSTRSVISITQEKKLVPKPEENTKTKFKDEPKRGSAKSVLHERCAVYDCCKVEGPCHMRLFTYKVVVEIRDSSGKTVLEIPNARRRLRLSMLQKERSGILSMLGETRQSRNSNSVPSQMK